MKTRNTVAILAVAFTILMLFALFLPVAQNHQYPQTGTLLDIAYAQNAWNGGVFDAAISVSVPTTGPTETPVIRIDNQGLGNSFEIDVAKTPIAYTNKFGQTYINPSADADATNYDYMFYLDYNMTGHGTKDRFYGIQITGAREAGEELTNGDHDDAGLRIRLDTHAITTTAGTVLRAIDAEAKADDPDGTSYNVYGAAITAKSDTGAGTVAGQMIALQTNAMNNAEVTTDLISADFRLMRQAATAPTKEVVIQVRNSSTSGSGADAAIYVTSDYATSATTDSFDYGLDMDTAAINTADVRGMNGETLSNVTDGAWIVGGFTAPTRQTVIDLASGGTITCLGTYCPITNATGGSIDTSASTAIADGPVAGALVIICNEDAQNVVIKNAANTLLSGDITLTGGNNDCISLIWNGSDWVGVANIDN